MHNILAALRHSLALVSVKLGNLLFADYSLDTSAHLSSCSGLKDGGILLVSRTAARCIENIKQNTCTLPTLLLLLLLPRFLYGVYPLVIPWQKYRPAR